MLLNLRIRKLCIHSYVHVLDVIVHTVILKREKLMVELTYTLYTAIEMT